MRAPRPLSAAADWIRHELPDRLPRPPGDIDPRLLWGLGAAVGVALIAWALASLLGGDDEPEVETRVVTVAVESDEPEAAPVGPLGFPLVATRNTTRIGGPDPATDAAAIALATHPRSPTAPANEAAVLVDAGDPYAGIAASVLAGPPLRAPILIGASGSLPDVTADALAKLAPQGGSGPADAAVYRVGDVASPSGLPSEQVGSGSAAEVAADLDELRTRLFRSPPRHILIASDSDAAYAMPAAAWAARSGDPVLFSGRDEVPEATLEALARHRGVPIYVLGPPSVISDEAVRELERISPGVTRIGAEGPVANAIAFARFADSSFGWNINDPGHGLVIASAARPLDAAAAAPLSASGKWGPLLVIEEPRTLTEDLRAFLLDIKPGFQEDPTRAVYNHVWVIGDTTAIGARVQAEVDELAELAEVGPGAGGPVGDLGTTDQAQPGLTPAPEAEPQPDQGSSGGQGGRP